MVSSYPPLLCDSVLLVCVTECVPPRRDTAGQERYQTITKQYYRRAQVTSAPTGCVVSGRLSSLTPLCVQGIIFVYDITNQPSFQHLAKWVSDVDEVSVL